MGLHAVRQPQLTSARPPIIDGILSVVSAPLSG